MAEIPQIVSAHFHATSKHADKGNDFVLGRHVFALDIHRGIESGPQEYGMHPVTHGNSRDQMDGDDIFVSGHSPRAPGRVAMALRSRVISRAHARLLWRSSQLFVLDQKSTHGTSVHSPGKEAEMLEPFREHRVRDGDVITFGREVSKGAETYQPPCYRVSFTYETSSVPRQAFPSSSAASVKSLELSKQTTSSSNTTHKLPTLTSSTVKPKPTSSSAIPFWGASPIPLDSEDEANLEDEEEGDYGRNSDDQIICTYRNPIQSQSQVKESSMQVFVLSDSEDDDGADDDADSSDTPQFPVIEPGLRMIDQYLAGIVEEDAEEGSDLEDSSDMLTQCVEEKNVSDDSDAVSVPGEASQTDAVSSDSGDDGSDTDELDEPTTPDLAEQSELSLLASGSKKGTDNAVILGQPNASMSSVASMPIEICEETKRTEDQAAPTSTYISVPAADETVLGLPVTVEASTIVEPGPEIAACKKRSADEAGLEGAEDERVRGEYSTSNSAVTPPLFNKRTKATMFSAGMATGFIAGIVGTVIGLSSFALSEGF